MRAGLRLYLATLVNLPHVFREIPEGGRRQPAEIVLEPDDHPLNLIRVMPAKGQFVVAIPSPHPADARVEHGRANLTAAIISDDRNAVCRNLPHTTHVVQRGQANVWKIGEKD